MSSLQYHTPSSPPFGGNGAPGGATGGSPGGQDPMALGNLKTTQEVRIAIQALHSAIATEPEPKDKAVIAKCLQALLQLQATDTAESQSGG